MTNRTRRRQAQWQHLIEQQRHSGLNAAASCRQQTLCRQSFYRYRKVLSENPIRLETGRFVQVKVKPALAPTTVMAVLDYRQARLQLPNPNEHRYPKTYRENASFTILPKPTSTAIPVTTTCIAWVKRLTSSWNLFQPASRLSNTFVPSTVVGTVVGTVNNKAPALPLKSRRYHPHRFQKVLPPPRC